MSTFIKNIEYFACGFCKNKLHHIFYRAPKQEMVFVAGVFLIHHANHGYILYDTGYTTDLLKNKLKYVFYRSLNPIYIQKTQMIHKQLEKKGIFPKDIKYIIVSHLHPDHIGALRYFPHATFLLTKNCYEALLKNSLHSLIFKELLPEDFHQRIQLIETKEIKKSFSYLKSYDLFSDQSILLSEMGGHAQGQCCAYFPEKKIFLAADSIWNLDFIEKIPTMRFLPRHIQYNFTEYQNNVCLLKKMLEDEIKILASHDNPNRIRRFLHEKDF